MQRAAVQHCPRPSIERASGPQASLLYNSQFVSAHCAQIKRDSVGPQLRWGSTPTNGAPRNQDTLLYFHSFSSDSCPHAFVIALRFHFILATIH